MDLQIGDKIRIGEDVKILIMRQLYEVVKGTPLTNQICLGIDAPKSIKIIRKEAVNKK